MIDVRVWYLSTNRLEHDHFDAFANVLSQLEREQAARFEFAHDRRDYLAAHVLLRHLLTSWSHQSPHAWTFESGAFGKPRVAAGTMDHAIEFNLSHTRGLVAAAVSHVPVGIDVERIGRRIDPSLAESLFAAPEVAELAKLPGAKRKRRFLELWTLKESYIKGMGAGLHQPLEHFCFATIGEEPVMQWLEKETAPIHEWRFVQTNLSADYVMAVAVQADREAQWNCEIREFDLSILVDQNQADKPDWSSTRKNSGDVQ